MMTMRFEFEGIDELIKELDRIEGMTPRLKNAALEAGGDVLRDRMKREVYAHGLDRISGDAQNSIVRTDPKGNELFVGTQGGAQAPGYYLYMHEFGYYNVRARRFIAPKPFASIAFENAKPDVLDAYVDVFRKGLGIT
jgi:HK97 gp10 family phage protein